MPKIAPALRYGFIALVAASIVAGPLLFSAAQQASEGEAAGKVRIGIFPNVTHAAALVALDQGLFADELEKVGTEVEFVYFNAGPNVIEAMKGSALDMSFIGPNPAVNGFLSTNGDLLRVVAGTGANGAQLVVSPEINSAQDLIGKQIATPQLGNTQDVALRTWLDKQGIETSVNAGQGDVIVSPMANADALTLFQSGEIAGAWVPEPWSSRFILEGGAKVLLDEVELWEGGTFLTSQLIAKTDFLEAYPKSVKAVINALVSAIEFIESNPEESIAATQRQLSTLAGKPIADDAMARAWSNIKATWDPLASSLYISAKDAAELGLIELPTDSQISAGEAKPLTDIHDLTLLNQVLEARGYETIELPVAVEGTSK